MTLAMRLFLAWYLFTAFVLGLLALDALLSWYVRMYDPFCERRASARTHTEETAP